MLKKYWNKLSNLGVNEQTPPAMKRHVMLLNKLAVVWIPMISIYAFVMTYNGLVVASIFIWLIVLNHILILFLNKNRTYDWSRLISVVIPNLLVFFAGAVSINPREEYQITYLLINLSLFLFPFLFYNSKEKGYLLFGILFCISLALFFPLVNAKLYLGENEEFMKMPGYILFNYGIAVFIILVGSIHFRSINDSSYELLSLQALQLEEKDRQLRRKDKEIERKNKELHDSLVFSGRIQRALQKETVALEKQFSESFAFYKPLNETGGDFYWATVKDNRIVIVVADCIGHGIPSALMSALGITFLNEIVHSLSDFNASILLEHFRTLFLNTLDNGDDYNAPKESMDVSLCIVDKNNLKMQFAGANSSIYMIRDNTLIEKKGCNAPIGIYHKEIYFENQDISIRKDDAIYMFSDGLTSQFGGVDNKKYQVSQFKHLLLEISGKTMKVQKNLIESEFNKWKGSNGQVDDVLIIGFKI